MSKRSSSSSGPPKKKVKESYSENASAVRERARVANLSSEEAATERARKNMNQAITRATTKLKAQADWLEWSQRQRDEEVAEVEAEMRKKYLEPKKRVEREMFISTEEDHTETGFEDYEDDLPCGWEWVQDQDDMSEEQVGALLQYSKRQLGLKTRDIAWKAIHNHWMINIQSFWAKVSMLNSPTLVEYDEAGNTVGIDADAWLELLGKDADGEIVLLHVMSESPARPPLPHEVFTIYERAVLRNVLTWDAAGTVESLTDEDTGELLLPGPAWLWPKDYDYYANGFLPQPDSFGGMQTPAEASALYDLCCTPIGHNETVNPYGDEALPMGKKSKWFEIGWMVLYRWVKNRTELRLLWPEELTAQANALGDME
ncbi:hypothetical protein LTR56_014932 [Elasticomyces elasticus]|nr:hypothetical protein LTR56_014932 [Elasticomyces elasticus]KAK3656270.1 hypothetical protein LTR22_009844 [Elasticomyces elasticus]KAK4924490.1 hypothetical protein LTR49_008379 [Elasticomyces elasticus]KAK5761688.1 hypothetical protein LTS12_008120 [Elasticomyces elasticus]